MADGSISLAEFRSAARPAIQPPPAPIPATGGWYHNAALHEPRTAKPAAEKLPQTTETVDNGGGYHGAAVTRDAAQRLADRKKMFGVVRTP